MNKRKTSKERERNKEEKVMKSKERSGAYLLKEMSFHSNSRLAASTLSEKPSKLSGNHFHIVPYERGDQRQEQSR